MRTIQLHRLAVIAALAWATTAVQAADPPAYRIVDLGLIGNAVTTGVSPDGRTVVGTWYADIWQTTVGGAWMWTEQTGLQAIPGLRQGPGTAATAVNNAGTVVGTQSAASGNLGRTMTWSNGVVTGLALPANYYLSDAAAINASGVVVGHAYPNVNAAAGQRAVVWVDGVPMPIEGVSDSGHYLSWAYGINDSGLVVGPGATSEGGGGPALRYDITTGTLTSLGVLPGDSGGFAYDINNVGYAAGFSSFYDAISGLNRQRAVLWAPSGEAIAIPLLSANEMSRAYAINERGWAVGASGYQGRGTPFLYADGSTYTLQSLLPANSGWTLDYTSDVSITDDGVIVSSGDFNGGYHAFMMVPVPEATRASMLLAGLALLAPALRRRRP